MKKTLFSLIAAGVLLMSCAEKKAVNPFFEEWNTPHGTVPFSKIKTEHFKPAILEGMKKELSEIDAIVNNTEEATFANTIEALDKTGQFYSKVTAVFYSFSGALTNDAFKKVEEELIQPMSEHSDKIALNDGLFKRIKAVYDKRESLNLDTQQMKLLVDTYKGFERGGANLNAEDKEKLKKLNVELSSLSNKFSKNILAEDNAFELVLEEKDLTGLPESVKAGAAAEAKKKGKEGKYVFTLKKPSLLPFLTYSDKRDLREKMFKGYSNRGNNNNEFDNKKNIARLAALRVQKANLLGYKTHADFMLENRMAKQPENVYNLLNKLWKPALKKSKTEVKDMQAIIKKEGGKFNLQPWDWWFYAEKVKKEKYNLDEQMIRPYFDVDKVREGAFAVASKLWGITFDERKDIEVYHKDVKVFEVKEADGKHIGILYTDYFPRDSKRGGAWMSSFRKQRYIDGKNVTPIIYNVGNFSKPVGDTPALLSVDEAQTLFHEFGHGLHGLLSDCKYNAQSGTSVPRDFVELPSQVMENWSMHPEVLKMYAKHYKTGEVIPDELIAKIEKSGHFNQGFVTVEYLAASFLDMDWHTLTESVEHDAIKFEEKAMKKIGLIDEIIPRYKSYYFNHAAGGYSAGYYAYIWAAVLDTDAFQAFVETSLFDQETAEKFRKYIFGAGGTDDAMTLYKKFRGKEPDESALLKKRGLM